MESLNKFENGYTVFDIDKEGKLISLTQFCKAKHLQNNNHAVQTTSLNRMVDPLNGLHDILKSEGIYYV